MTRKTKTQSQSRQSGRSPRADKTAAGRASGRLRANSVSRSSAAVRDRAAGSRGKGNGNEVGRHDSGRFESRGQVDSQRASQPSRSDSDYRPSNRSDRNDWRPSNDHRNQEPSRYRDENPGNYSRPDDYDHGREVSGNDNRYFDDRAFRGSSEVRRASSQDSGRYQGNDNPPSRGQRGNYPDSNLNGPREDYREDTRRFETENDPDYGQADRGGRPDYREEYRHDDRGYRGETDDRGTYRSERDVQVGELDRDYINRDAERSAYRGDEVSRREYASVGGRNDPQESWRGNGGNERSSRGNGRSTRPHSQAQSGQSRSGRKTAGSRGR